MANLDQWVEELVVEVPGATMAGMLNALRKTIRVFCMDSGAYVLEQEVPIDLTAAQATYNVMTAFPTLVASDDHIPVFILAVGYFSDFANSSQMRFLTPLKAPNYRASATSSLDSPWGYTTSVQVPGEFTVFPTPAANESQRLGVFVAFRLKDYPSFPDTTVPELFATYWYDVILDGAIGVLCAEQDKSYTNPQKATLHQRRFRNGIGRARDQARNQFNTSADGFLYPRVGGWL